MCLNVVSISVMFVGSFTKARLIKLTEWMEY